MRCLRLFLLLATGSQLLCAREGPVPLSDVTRRSPIQLGAQLMTGYRSNYIFRGEELGRSVIEGQIASAIALSNDWALAGEADFLRGFEQGHFSQTTLYGELQYYVGDECTIGPSFAYQGYSDSYFKSGVEPGLAWRWNPVPDWSFSAAGVYDTGQEGFYGNAAISWQPLITDNIAWQTTAVFGASSDYMGSSGPSDLLLRTGWLIRMGASFRLQPFVGVNFSFGNRNEKKLIGGVWFSWVY